MFGEGLGAGGRTAVRLAVLDNTPDAFPFWTSLGYEVVARRRDLQLGRPCRVLRKELSGAEGLEGPQGAEWAEGSEGTGGPEGPVGA